MSKRSGLSAILSKAAQPAPQQAAQPPAPASAGQGERRKQLTLYISESTWKQMRLLGVE